MTKDEAQQQAGFHSLSGLAAVAKLSDRTLRKPQPTVHITGSSSKFDHSNKIFPGKETALKAILRVGKRGRRDAVSMFLCHDGTFEMNRMQELFDPNLRRSAFDGCEMAL